MTSTNPSKSFQNVCDAKRVFQHYEKLEVENSLDFSEAIESFEVIIMYKRGLSAKTPSRLSNFRTWGRDLLVSGSGPVSVRVFAG